ncbi:acyl-CoA dehydrogenase [Chloropicon primus]|uniref:Acyl-CoA dehydrogenase n=2 Tax=Chloropicon primus TaxID=1764295 RepID=A0A5B8MXY6_9CHLO|nr:acyl-CoA dehydrogenase [Chloropicon primus]UPR03620.1 acyl-CoA dehydrogenase [Chloropicon primus]|mmetsp:Transcript_4803/g.14332  ORF Transcript_4803/g.14332 Transcript_4803/m.14332 type:complete len:435 (+) Transcript_4803:209-1513(+)|eukprot:QDZ24412.1 acyl-CoA dehydrogenase [Chloropicon primus]
MGGGNIGEGRQPVYGTMVPFGDPSWYRGHNSPYYRDTHHAWRAKIRAFCESEIMPYCKEWDDEKKLPDDLLRKCYEAQILPASCGGQWPTEYVGPGPADFDAFHELIMIDELSRCGSGGVMWGIMGGLAIGLPPVLQNASKYIKDKVAADCLNGSKRICLCITEPTHGSDVANLRTSAVKSKCGKFYVVNGEKKWITNGIMSDFFTVAVRTGGPGPQGISMVLIEKSMPGVKCRQMDCTGVWASGTTYITFDDVKVPVENLIGQEGHGFRYIMYNFNHERWMLIAQAVRFARVCLEESVKHAMRRKTFGKKLIEHPVIRLKIAEMARQVEATQAMLESLTYQMNTMSKEEQNLKLGGDTAMLKVQATKVYEYCARESQQILGGIAYTKGGLGEKVERLGREVRAYAIPGGSEEIMLDLSVRQAMKISKVLKSKM